MRSLHLRPQFTMYTAVFGTATDSHRMTDVLEKVEKSMEVEGQRCMKKSADNLKVMFSGPCF